MTRLIGARKAILAAAIAAAAFAVPALAQPQPTAAVTDRAAALKQLSDCRTVADEAERLACYDAAAAAVDAAEASGELVVMDRGQVQSAKRSLFGFDTSALNIFDRGDPERRVVVDNVTLTVERAYRGEGGKWVVVMSDGQVWQQVDNTDMYKAPKAGMEARIRKAALGSYFMNIDGQTAIRARRIK